MKVFPKTSLRKLFGATFFSKKVAKTLNKF